MQWDPHRADPEEVDSIAAPTLILPGPGSPDRDVPDLETFAEIDNVMMSCRSASQIYQYQVPGDDMEEPELEYSGKRRRFR